MTAANSNHGKYFTSVDYTADGTCVVAAGHSKFVCIYECSQQILVKKFQVSTKYIISTMAMMILNISSVQVFCF